MSELTEAIQAFEAACVLAESIQRLASRTATRLGPVARSRAALRPRWLQQYWGDRPGFRASMDDAESRAVYALQHGQHHFLGDRLGGGVGGATYTSRTYPGTVVKFDKGKKEANLVKLIKSTPALKKLSILPRYYSVADTGVTDEKTGDKLLALHREDLKDIENSDKTSPWHHYGRAVSDMADELADSGKERHDYRTLRQRLDDIRNKFRHTFKPADRMRFDQAHRDMHVLLRHGIIPNDLHCDNWGRRANGEHVIRDAGGYHHIEFENEA